MLIGNIINNSERNLYFVQKKFFINLFRIQIKPYSFIIEDRKTSSHFQEKHDSETINTQRLVINNSKSDKSTKIIYFQRSLYSIYPNNNFLGFNKTFKKNFCNKASDKDQTSAHSQQIEKEFLKLDYYSMLNLKHNFHEGELRKNYVQLAKHFHPDRFKGSPEIFKRLSEAYQTLKDENKREEYNRKLKIKIHKNYKKARSESGFKSEANQEELRKASKFEEDFKKLNIDKLFHDFSNKKIKTSHEKIKTYKSNLERKMSPREHKIHELITEYKQNQLLSRDTKYNFYKEFGLIKDQKIDKNYSELVKEEIDRIKNKNNLSEKIKKREKEELNKEEEYNYRLKIFLKRLFVFYILSLFALLYIKQNNQKVAEEKIKKEIELSEQMRFSNYVYVGDYKI